MLPVEKCSSPIDEQWLHKYQFVKQPNAKNLRQ